MMNIGNMITIYFLIGTLALLFYVDAVSDENEEENIAMVGTNECSIDNAEYCRDTKMSPTATGEGSCSLYLAPSSIPNSGYGIFTTRSYKMHDEIFDGRSLSVIVIEKELNANVSWLISDYMWQTFGAGAYEGSVADTWEPTPLGSLGNYHPYLTNYAPFGNAQRYDDTQANRFTDPEAGAFSYHRSFSMGATRDIAAGEELFAEYGEEYIETRTHDGEDVYRLIPRASDYEQASSVAKIISESDISKRQMSTIQNLVNTLANERVMSVLPKDPTNYTKYRNMSLSDIALDLAWGTVERRSVDWIVRNGKCLDGHFDIQKSTIPKAGLGTFALRKIKKGEMIAPATLVHISDKESLNMFNRTPDPDTVDFVKFDKRPKTEVERPIGKQMLMNYCFGHRDSSVVLCPTITAAAMNHCSNRTRWGGQCTKSGANAGYRWPQDWSPETKEWLQLSYEELKNSTGRGLVLEIVATRDIEVGNEIFLDYGLGWERAWARHQSEWVSPRKIGSLSSYTSVTELNNKTDPPRSLSELAERPLPDNVVTGCIYNAEYDDSYDNFDPGLDWTRLSDEEILENFAKDGSMFMWHEGNTPPKFWPCSVIAGSMKDDYTVRIFQASWEHDTPWAEKGLPIILTKYPRASIRYFHRQGHSDQFLPKSFRHHPELPDQIFPDQWKNKLSI